MFLLLGVINETQERMSNLFSFLVVTQKSLREKTAETTTTMERKKKISIRFRLLKLKESNSCRGNSCLGEIILDHTNYVASNWKHVKRRDRVLGRMNLQRT